nr:PREDICTED: uncharacterized protein LOC109043100 [Bemisia tabaci]
MSDTYKCHPSANRVRACAHLFLKPHHYLPGLNLHKEGTETFSSSEKDLLTFSKPFPFKSSYPVPLLPPNSIGIPAVNKFDLSLALIREKYIRGKKLKKVKHSCRSRYKKDDVYKAMVDRMPLDSNLDDDLSGVLPVNIAKLALLYEDDPDPYFKGKYNWYYGGTLSVQKNKNMEFVTISAAGKALDELHMKTFNPCEKLKCETFVLSDQMMKGSPIYEVSKLRKKKFLSIRQRNMCAFLKLLKSENSMKTLLCLDSKVPFVGVDTSPFSKSEVCMIKANRIFQVWDVEGSVKEPKLKGQLPTKVHYADNWCNFRYGSQPNEVLAADRINTFLYDLRMDLTKPANQWNPWKQSELCEEISLLRSSAVSPVHCYVGTSHQIFSLDLRSSFCQRWTHMLRTAPYIATSVRRDDMELLLFCSQHTPRVECIINDWTSVEVPVSRVFPRILPSIADVYQEAKLSNICNHPIVECRFDSCLTGLASVKNENDFALLSNTSSGDIFYQTLSFSEEPDQSKPTLNKVELKTLKQFEKKCVRKFTMEKKTLHVTSDFADFHEVAEKLKMGEPEAEEVIKPTVEHCAGWQIPKDFLESCKDYLAPRLLEMWDIKDLPDWSIEPTPGKELEVTSSWPKKLPIQHKRSIRIQKEKMNKADKLFRKVGEDANTEMPGIGDLTKNVENPTEKESENQNNESDNSATGDSTKKVETLTEKESENQNNESDNSATGDLTKKIEKLTERESENQNNNSDMSATITKKNNKSKRVSFHCDEVDESFDKATVISKILEEVRRSMENGSQGKKKTKRKENKKNYTNIEVSAKQGKQKEHFAKIAESEDKEATTSYAEERKRPEKIENATQIQKSVENLNKGRRKEKKIKKNQSCLNQEKCTQKDNGAISMTSDLDQVILDGVNLITHSQGTDMMITEKEKKEKKRPKKKERYINSKNDTGKEIVVEDTRNNDLQRIGKAGSEQKELKNLDRTSEMSGLPYQEIPNCYESASQELILPRLENIDGQSSLSQKSDTQRSDQSLNEQNNCNQLNTVSAKQKAEKAIRKKEEKKKKNKKEESESCLSSGTDSKDCETDPKEFKNTEPSQLSITSSPKLVEETVSVSKNTSIPTCGTSPMHREPSQKLEVGSGELFLPPPARAKESLQQSPSKQEQIKIRSPCDNHQSLNADAICHQQMDHFVSSTGVSSIPNHSRVSPDIFETTYIIPDRITDPSAHDSSTTSGFETDDTSKKRKKRSKKLKKSPEATSASSGSESQKSHGQSAETSISLLKNIKIVFSPDAKAVHKESSSVDEPIPEPSSNKLLENHHSEKSEITANDSFLDQNFQLDFMLPAATSTQTVSANKNMLEDFGLSMQTSFHSENLGALGNKFKSHGGLSEFDYSYDDDPSMQLSNSSFTRKRKASIPEKSPKKNLRLSQTYTPGF